MTRFVTLVCLPCQCVKHCVFDNIERVTPLFTYWVICGDVKVIPSVEIFAFSGYSDGLADKVGSRSFYLQSIIRVDVDSQLNINICLGCRFKVEDSSDYNFVVTKPCGFCYFSSVNIIVIRILDFCVACIFVLKFYYFACFGSIVFCIQVCGTFYSRGEIFAHSPLVGIIIVMSYGYPSIAIIANGSIINEPPASVFIIVK